MVEARSEEGSRLEKQLVELAYEGGPPPSPMRRICMLEAPLAGPGCCVPALRPCTEQLGPAWVFIRAAGWAGRPAAPVHAGIARKSAGHRAANRRLSPEPMPCGRAVTLCSSPDEAAAHLAAGRRAFEVLLVEVCGPTTLHPAARAPLPAPGLPRALRQARQPPGSGTGAVGRDLTPFGAHMTALPAEAACPRSRLEARPGFFLSASVRAAAAAAQPPRAEVPVRDQPA